MATPPPYGGSLGSNFSGTTSPVVAVPSGITATNTYIIVVLATDTQHVATVTPSGWTLLGWSDDGSPESSGLVLGKVADATDASLSSSSGSWTLTGAFDSAESGRAVASYWTGVDESDPLSGLPVIAPSNSTSSKTLPTVTTDTADCTYVGVLTCDPGADPRTVTGVGAGATARHTSQNALLGWVHVLDMPTTTAGAYSTTATLNAAEHAVNFGVALNPATAGGGQSSEIGLITFTGTPQAMSRSKSVGIGQASETDTAQAATRSKSVSISLSGISMPPPFPSSPPGPLSESDFAFPMEVQSEGQQTLGLITETSAPLAMTTAKDLSIGMIAAEPGQLFPVGGSAGFFQTIGLITETGAAQAMTSAGKSWALGRITETGVVMHATSLGGARPEVRRGWLLWKRRWRSNEW